MSAIMFLIEIWFIIVLIAIGIMSISRILDTFENNDNN